VARATAFFVGNFPINGHVHEATGSDFQIAMFRMPTIVTNGVWQRTHGASTLGRLAQRAST
jgi:hypothetical protein